MGEPSSSMDRQHLQPLLRAGLFTIVLALTLAVRHIAVPEGPSTPLSAETHHSGNSVSFLAYLNAASNYSCVHPGQQFDPCAYVNTDQCTPSGLINYLALPYCSMRGHTLLAYSVLLLALFLILSATSIAADDYFSPNLVTISEALGLSQNIAGVTILALGNGAPDIFSAVAAVGGGPNTANLAIASLYGGGLFVTTVVLGGVGMVADFRVTRRPFARDVIFYLAAAVGLTAVLYSGKMYFWQAAGFIAMYFAYVAVVVGGRWIYQKRKPALPPVISYGSTDTASVQVVGSVDSVTDIVIPVPSAEIKGPPPFQYRQEPTFATHKWLALHEPPKRPEIPRRNSFTITRAKARMPLVRSRSMSPPNRRRIQPTTPEDPPRSLLVPPQSPNHLLVPTWSVEAAPSGDYEPMGRRHDVIVGADLWTIPSEELSPLLPSSVTTADVSTNQRVGFGHSLRLLVFGLFFSLKALKQATWLQRISLALQQPLHVVFGLTIPLVDMDQSNARWIRPLHMLQCLCAPPTLVFLSGWGCTVAYCVSIGVGAVLCATVAMATTNHKPPRAHAAVAALGFAMGIAWIKILANELVSILTALGVIFSISPDLMGMTVLAWANNIMDLIVDVAMGRSGYPQMAVGAVYGSPLLNMLMGMGLAGLSATSTANPISLLWTNRIGLASFFLCLSLLVSLVLVPLRGFRVDRTHGAILFAVYAAYIVCVILREAGMWGASHP